MNWEPININNNNAQHEALKAHQDKYVKDDDTCKDVLSFPMGSTVAMQDEDGRPWMHGVLERLTTVTTEGNGT